MRGRILYIRVPLRGSRVGRGYGGSPGWPARPWSASGHGGKARGIWAGWRISRDTGELYRGTAASLAADLAAGIVAFHPDRVGGVWPTVRVAGG